MDDPPRKPNPDDHYEPVSRSVGQVQPAPRQPGQLPMDAAVPGTSGTQTAQRKEEPSRSVQSMRPRGPQRMQQRPLVPGQVPARGLSPGASASPGITGVGHAPQPDLRRSLGLKFGGQISITSNEQSPGRSGSESGVSITKMKDDGAVGSPVSIRDHQRVTSQSYAQSRGRHSSLEQPVEVKEEPYEDEEAYDDEEEEEEEYNEYAGYDPYATADDPGIYEHTFEDEYAQEK